MKVPSPARLLIVLTSGVRGGIEEVVLSLLQHLDRRDFLPALAAPEGLLEAMGSDLSESAVPTFRVSADSWLNWQEVRNLSDIIRGFRPDIVNPHLFRSTLVAAPLGRWRGVPTIVETYHGREAWRRTGIRGSFLPDRLVSRAVDRVIAVSEAARDFLVRVKRIPAEKIVVVPNGRDLSAFRPGCGGLAARQELGVAPEAPLLGIVGRLEPQKGHRFGLQAFAHVKREFPDARLVIVGEGALREALLGQVRDLGLGDDVIFTGFQEDVPRLLDAVDLVILPSLYEGMPLTAIEAAAMAKPIVASAVDGTVEVVRDGATGRLVAPEDPLAIAEACNEILSSSDRGRALGERGRQLALELFTVEAHAASTAEVYRQCLRASGLRMRAVSA